MKKPLDITRLLETYYSHTPLEIVPTIHAEKVIDPHSIAIKVQYDRHTGLFIIFLHFYRQIPDGPTTSTIEQSYALSPFLTHSDVDRVFPMAINFASLADVTDALQGSSERVLEALLAHHITELFQIRIVVQPHSVKIALELKTDQTNHPLSFEFSTQPSYDITQSGPPFDIENFITLTP